MIALWRPPGSMRIIDEMMENIIWISICFDKACKDFWRANSGVKL
jgi:hypothetical protein